MSLALKTSITAAFLACCLLACSESNTPEGNSQTHWLKGCSSDAECGDDLTCICGACAASCAAEAPCNVRGITTTCMGTDAPSVTALCGAPAPTMVCLQSCADDAGCGVGQRCAAGACVPAQESPTAGSDGGSGAGGTGGGAGGTGGSSGVGGSSGAGGEGGSGGGDACQPGGCSGQLCTDQADIASDCEWREEYACYATATCERQSDGNCGWTQTAELTQCIDNARQQGLTWYSSCGDPVCGPSPMDIPDLENCTSETEGSACTQEGASCDPVAGCGVRLVCAASDPKTGPGGCPISRARFKRDIHYLGVSERQAYADELMSLPLATYSYRADADGRPQLGFIIEDVEPSMSVDSSRDQVNLYGYTTMAVAALQVQAEQIEALSRELLLLRSYLGELEGRGSQSLRDCPPQR
ncbi:MAG: tail fiber domain-containing protein [Myxococcales bacterium]|nr:tail fiber domain-containing protein [Myxococcales bacterium]